MSDRERIAEVLYDGSVVDAKDSIRKIEFSLVDQKDLFVKLKKESSIGRFLIFHSFLEDRVPSLIQQRLWHLENKDSKNNLFSGFGPLSSFSSQILISYHLGWISPKTFKKLEALRRIRNYFGHYGFKASLSDDKVTALLKLLQMDLGKYFEVISEFDNHEDYYDEKSTPNDRKLLCCLALLADFVFEELIVYPEVHMNKVHPKDLMGDYDACPDVIKNIRLWTSDSITHALLK